MLRVGIPSTGPSISATRVRCPFVPIRLLPDGMDSFIHSPSYLLLRVLLHAMVKKRVGEGTRVDGRWHTYICPSSEFRARPARHGVKRECGEGTRMDGSSTHILVHQVVSE
jgi:hypothetical protein